MNTHFFQVLHRKRVQLTKKFELLRTARLCSGWSSWRICKTKPGQSQRLLQGLYFLKAKNTLFSCRMRGQHVTWRTRGFQERDFCSTVASFSVSHLASAFSLLRSCSIISFYYLLLVLVWQWDLTKAEGHLRIFSFWAHKIHYSDCHQYRSVH